jgi:hypothetical protein
MFRNLLNNIRQQIIAAIVAAGGDSNQAAQFVSSIGNGQLLQMLLQFFAANGPEIEQFIQFIVSLFQAQPVASMKK